jgi:hypothetical protein
MFGDAVPCVGAAPSKRLASQSARR